MKPGIINLHVEGGVTYRKTMLYLPGGAPADFTGVTAVLQIVNPTGTLVAELTTENGGLTLESTTGGITIYMPPTETTELAEADALAAQPLRYELELISSPTEKRRIVRGEVTANAELYP